MKPTDGVYELPLDGGAALLFTDALFNLPEDILIAPTGGEATLFFADRGNRRHRAAGAGVAVVYALSDAPGQAPANPPANPPANL